MNTTALTECLCCGGKLSPLIDFGPTRLANTYGVEEKFPLALNLCDDCFHLQLTQNVAPHVLYGDYYYCSGTSRTSRAFFDWFALMAMAATPGAGNVLDIACNDGTQLDCFMEYGLETFGCDPAKSVADLASVKGHMVNVSMFETMQGFVDDPFDIITAQNVLAHTPYPLLFLQRAKQLMHDSSRLFIVTSQADMIVKNECDTVYHEHVSYFNLRSMMELAKRAGLKVLDVGTHPIHGTSYIFTLGKSGQPSERVNLRYLLEQSSGLYTEDCYWCWGLAVKRSIAKFKNRIQAYKSCGFVTVGLGAAAKGISMLNMAGVKLDYLFDTTPMKQGKIASGMLIQPFEEIADLKEEKVLFVILGWNFESEIRENCAKYRNNPNDVFITDK